jgi:hypothetical protein
MKVVPDYITNTDRTGRRSNPRAAAGELHDSYTNFSIVVGSGDIGQVHGDCFFHSRVYGANLVASHTTGSINEIEQGHDFARGRSNLI